MPNSDITKMCSDIIAACRDARITQTRFLTEHGHMSWKVARNLPQTERDALQAEYARWLNEKGLNR